MIKQEFDLIWSFADDILDAEKKYRWTWTSSQSIFFLVAFESVVITDLLNETNFDIPS